MAKPPRYNYSYTPLWSGNLELSNENQASWCFWRRRRWVVALLAFFGFFNVYALRVNLSVAVVAMTEPVETKLENGTVVHVLTSVHILGDGSYQRGTGQDHGLSLSQTTVSKYLAQVTEAIIIVLMPQWINFPGTESMRQRVSHGFLQKHGLPDVLGAIDCTHVDIFPPPFPSGIQYKNRKGRTTINVQLLPEFDWSSQTKGLVLSSFFYGYIVTQLPGGWLAARLGGNRVFAIGVGATSLLTLFTPPLAHTSTGLLIAVRVVEGLFEGVTYPCIHALWSRWAPSDERARLATFAFSGSYAGTVVSMPICSLLAKYTGWPGIFYVFGIMGLVWTTIWWLVVKESPEKDPHITPAELKYIQDSRGTQAVEGSKIKHPWKAMLTSKPVWAIVMAHFSENWGFYTLLTFLPTFMQDVFKFETSQTGFLSAVPYLAMAIVLQVAGQLADWMLRRGFLSRTNIRKLFNCGAFLAQTIFMIAAAYSSSVVTCLVFLTIAVGLGGFAWSGFSVNHLDLAPPHASVLMGLSNTVATLPGIISPPLAGAIVTNKTAEEWRVVFFISSLIYLLGAIIYGMFCSGEKQPWVVEVESDVSFDTETASVTTTRGYDNKALDTNSEM